ncbi:MAG TPA: hypothetical protein VKD21_15405, partial [Acidimicrobiales bacterium]|nr:hypothetical protein [Acidimicrobiales bacterium]
MASTRRQRSRRHHGLDGRARPGASSGGGPGGPGGTGRSGRGRVRVRAPLGGRGGRAGRGGALGRWVPAPLGDAGG